MGQSSDVAHRAYVLIADLGVVLADMCTEMKQIAACDDLLHSAEALVALLDVAALLDDVPIC